jgi:hypothetical protein
MSPQISKFAWQPFVSRARELTEESQARLFEVVEPFPVGAKLELFMKSVPPWRSGVKSHLLAGLVKRTSWGDDAARLLGFLVAEPKEYELLSENVTKDKELVEILDCLVGQLNKINAHYRCFQGV